MDQTLSHHSSEENGFGVFVPQRRPLYKEVVGYRIQDLPSERQRLDTANTLSVNYQDFLYSQNSKEESCYTKGNARPRAVTQHLEKHRRGRGEHTSRKRHMERGYSVHLLQNCVSCDIDWLGSVPMCTPCRHSQNTCEEAQDDTEHSSLCSQSSLTSSDPPVEAVRVKEGVQETIIRLVLVGNIFKAKHG